MKGETNTKIKITEKVRVTIYLAVQENTGAMQQRKNVQTTAAIRKT